MLGPRSTPARRLAAALILVTLAAPAAQAAQAVADEAPSRIGPIWNGRKHEPAPDSTRAAERSTGVLPSQAEQQREQATVDQTYRKLTGGDPQRSTLGPPGSGLAR